MRATLERFVCNFDGEVRYANLEGRRYLVVPMVMLTEGVHEGSQGPLYYSRKELSKNPAVWNHKPIVVYHPETSACDPIILDTRKIGLILNSRYRLGVVNGKTVGKLHAEAWLEVSRAKQIDSRVLNAISNNEKVEVSTGLWTESDEKPGVWNGEAYDASAFYFQPDHLAILPDQVGACSIEDGAGLLQFNSRINQSMIKKLTNGRWRLTAANGKKLGVFDSKKEAMTFNRRHQKKVEAAEAVKNKEKDMSKKKYIDALIANGVWEEDDREEMLKLDEARLKRMASRVDELAKNQATEEDDEDDDEEEVVPAKNKKGKKEVKNETKIPSLEEYILNAPPEIGQMLAASVSVRNQRRGEIIEIILNHKGNIYTKEILEKLDDQVLAGAFALVQAEAGTAPNTANVADILNGRSPLYLGVAGGQQKQQTKNKKEQKPLGLPTMNFKNIDDDEEEEDEEEDAESLTGVN